MFIIQKEICYKDRSWKSSNPIYSLLVSNDCSVAIARDIKKDYPEWMMFNSISEISWWYLDCDDYKIAIDDADWYSRCEVETPKKIITYRRKEYDVWSDYLFFNLFECN